MPRRSIVALGTESFFARPQETRTKLLQDIRRILMNEIYDMVDLDGDNRIKSNEVRQILGAMGREPNNEEIMDFLKIADKDNSGLVDKLQFMEAMEKIYSIPIEGVEEVKQSFAFFDPEETGKISTEKLKKILLAQDDFSEEDVEKIIKLADPDEIGYIDYDNFVDVWKFQ